MKTSLPREEHPNGECNERFLEFVRLFAGMNANEGLFPRECRVCGTTFRNVAEYCYATYPKGHCFEDCRDLAQSDPFMMLYRHCKCGNTLVLRITEKIFPDLDAFWQMLHHEAEDSARPLKEVIAEFSDKCDCYLLNLKDSCGGEKD
ncbi:MAG: hypothetical protein HY912_17325 [Desulfomonile tiedjei]|uniref:Uncharacterized protein n=1 Tax=Desulfomonile tiedjei TaxID=2358 RepID=A0A9D6V496_9BACT|nr:hypothetical protein [Desulfomonile tiedjei]